MKALETPAKIGIKEADFSRRIFLRAVDAAIPYTTEIVRRFGAQLYALHVRPPVINPMTEPTAWPALEKAAKAEADAQNQALRATFPGIKLEVLIEEGDVWKILEWAVEKQEIDLIVLGTRGRSGAAKFFLGSQAEEIFRRGPLRGVDNWPACARENRREVVSLRRFFARPISVPPRRVR